MYISSNNKFLHGDTNNINNWDNWDKLYVKLPESKSEWIIIDYSPRHVELMTFDEIENINNMEEALS